MPDPTGRSDAAPSPADDYPPVLEVIADRDDTPTRFTFVPRTAEDAERTTTWLTAAVEDVADLEAWR